MFPVQFLDGENLTDLERILIGLKRQPLKEAKARGCIVFICGNWIENDYYRVVSAE